MTKTKIGAAHSGQTQVAQLPMRDIRNWARISRGHSPQLEGIALQPIVEMQVAHRDFLISESLRTEGYHHYEDNERDNAYAHERQAHWKIWDTQQFQAFDSPTRQILGDALTQMWSSQSVQSPRFVWHDWLEDTDSLAVTRHPLGGDLRWAPDFSLPIAGVYDGDMYSVYTYQTQFGWMDGEVVDENYKYHGSQWRPYDSELPMYAWEPEKVVVAAIFELLRRVFRGNDVEILAGLTLPWKSVYQNHPVMND